MRSHMNYSSAGPHTEVFLRPEESALLQGARGVITGNDIGTMVKAADGMYPHQWSWDAAFVSIALAHGNVDRALREWKTLLDGQWSTGMLPHIVFSDAPNYFPGPEVWETDRARAKPPGVRTSSIGQPPVHGTCLRRVLDIASARADHLHEAERFARQALPKLAAWHEWLSRWRDNPSGLVEIHHGWASGMDNSPRFDEIYRSIRVPEPIDISGRHDTGLVDAAQRPTNAEYERYLWLVKQLAAAAFEDEQIVRSHEFRFGDVFSTAALALAAEDLASLAQDLGAAEIASSERERSESCRAAVAAAVDPNTGLCQDYDVRTGTWLSTDTIAGFSLLISGGPDADVARQRSTLLGEHWMGHPHLRYALPPSVSPDSPAFRPTAYWRGPVWPIMNWYLSYAARRRGDSGLGALIRTEGLRQLADDGTYAEYYEPTTGLPLGAPRQSWTAMAAIDWLDVEDWSEPLS